MVKILVIEDDLAVLDNTVDVLLLEGFQPVVAQNGQDGIAKAITEKPCLILCDIAMPGLDGYGVLDALRNNDETCNIPFVFMSAYANEEEIERATALGIDYLVKPFAIMDLVRLVKSYMDS